MISIAIFLMAFVQCRCQKTTLAKKTAKTSLGTTVQPEVDQKTLDFLQECEAKASIRHSIKFDPGESALRNCLVRQALSALTNVEGFNEEDYAVGAAQSVFDRPINRGWPLGMANLVPSTRFVDIACQGAFPIRCNSSARFRSITGVCNNLNNQLWGASSTKFRRFIPSAYADNIGEPRGGVDSSMAHCDTGNKRTASQSDCETDSKRLLPNPRYVSFKTLGGVSVVQAKHTSLLMQFGQFFDHDVTLTPETEIKDCCLQPQQEGCLPIYIPCGDPHFLQPENKPRVKGGAGPLYRLGRLNKRLVKNKQQQGTTTATSSAPKTSSRPRTRNAEFCLEFKRSVEFCFKGSSKGKKQSRHSGVREQLNGATAFADGSSIYGHEFSLARKLRDFKGGRMKMKNKNRSMPVLKGLSISGDPRALEMPGLGAVTTLFLREHNRIATELSKVCCNGDDEELYQRARRINNAQLQNLYFQFYIPEIIGKETAVFYHLDLKFPSRYNPKINPSIRNAFSAAAMRFGHSTVNNATIMMDAKGKVVTSFRVKDAYFSENFLKSDGGLGADYIINGLSNTPMESNDMNVVEDIWNFLFVNESGITGDDLLARNIHRGRDHGLPPYNEFREFCGLDAVCSWAERPQEIPEKVWNDFASVYDRPADIDLYIGGLAEAPYKDSVVGRTFTCLMAKQFYAMKFGDRFFFTHRGYDIPFPFDDKQLQNVLNRRLSDIICDNLALEEIRSNPFLLTGPKIKCGDHRRLDMNLFSDDYEVQARNVLQQELENTEQNTNEAADSFISKNHPAKESSDAAGKSMRSGIIGGYYRRGGFAKPTKSPLKGKDISPSRRIHHGRARDSLDEPQKVSALGIEED